MLVTTRLTEIEVRRDLTRLVARPEVLDRLRQDLARDLDGFAFVALDATTCNEAASVAERTRCRALDAVHIGAARRAGSATTILTFDVRQARAARQIGMSVIGA